MFVLIFVVLSFTTVFHQSVFAKKNVEDETDFFLDFLLQRDLENVLVITDKGFTSPDIYRNLYYNYFPTRQHSSAHPHSESLQNEQKVCNSEISAKVGKKFKI